MLDVDEDIISDEGDRGLRYDKFECREVSSQHDYRMYESMLKVNSGAEKYRVNANIVCASQYSRFQLSINLSKPREYPEGDVD